MKTLATLCMLMIAIPAIAGTYRNDFSNANLDGWAPVTGNMPLVHNALNTCLLGWGIAP